MDRSGKLEGLALAKMARTLEAPTASASSRGCEELKSAHSPALQNSNRALGRGLRSETEAFLFPSISSPSKRTEKYYNNSLQLS